MLFPYCRLSPVQPTVYCLAVPYEQQSRRRFSHIRQCPRLFLVISEIFARPESSADTARPSSARAADCIGFHGFLAVVLVVLTVRLFLTVHILPAIPAVQGVPLVHITPRVPLVLVDPVDHLDMGVANLCPVRSPRFRGLFPGY